jgi:hypothetical protein
MSDGSEAGVTGGPVAVLACRIWNEDEYPPHVRAVWDRVVREGLGEGTLPPIVYPGSRPAACDRCGVTVAVGPRQQQVASQHPADQVSYLCLVCVAFLTGGVAEVQSLGNPDDPNA